jgi:hypothetical protein
VNFSKKAQMKIQQMAFMLVAVMIFFAMVAIIYFTIVYSRLQDTAADLQEEEAKELARQMAGTPELMFSKKAFPESSSVDMAKALFLKQHGSYKKGYWNLDYLAIERVYPKPDPIEKECKPDGTNIATCRYLTLIDNAHGNYSGTQTAPVAIVWWDQSLGPLGTGEYRFDLGRIHALAHDTTK